MNFKIYILHLVFNSYSYVSIFERKNYYFIFTYYHLMYFEMQSRDWPNQANENQCFC
jgi:hypothetical protein